MKSLFVGILAALSLNLNAQIKMPAASPSQTISQEFGLGKIEVSYARPSLKGRTAFGKGSLLAPVGEVWRTGANSATKVTISEPLNVGATTLPAGSYALFTIPGEDEWTIIFNSNIKSWGSSDYKASEDIVRFKVAPLTTQTNSETFTIGFDDITAETAILYIQWGKTKVNIPLSANIRPTIRQQIADVTTAPNANPNSFQAAANFYYEIDKDYDKALVYVDKAINANGKAFWLFLLKAKVQKELKDKKGAKLSADTCIKLAEEAKNADYVRSANDFLKTL